MHNQIKIILKTIVALVFSIGIAYADSTSLQQCAAITDAAKRLKCFDQLSHSSTPVPSAKSSPTNPALQTVQADLQEAWDKDIRSVTIDTSSALIIHTDFKTVNQTTYEVMLPVVCGALAFAA